MFAAAFLGNVYLLSGAYKVAAGRASFREGHPASMIPAGFAVPLGLVELAVGGAMFVPGVRLVAAVAATALSVIFIGASVRIAGTLVADCGCWAKTPIPINRSVITARAVLLAVVGAGLTVALTNSIAQPAIGEVGAAGALMVLPAILVLEAPMVHQILVVQRLLANA